jgi:hypothetical protein
MIDFDVRNAMLMEKATVTSSAKLVWLYIQAKARRSKEGRVHVSVKMVAVRLGMGENTVWRSIESLREEGYISWSPIYSDYHGRQKRGISLQGRDYGRPIKWANNGWVKILG